MDAIYPPGFGLRLGRIPHPLPLDVHPRRDKDWRSEVLQQDLAL